MENKNLLISIIIVNYNGAKFLPRLLKSIYAQTFKDYEIILVDNGSKDNSIDYIRKEHPVVKLVEYENKGYGAGCNRGVKLASGELVTFLNEDMYLPRDFLDKMHSTFEKIDGSGLNIGGLGCKMVGFNQEPYNSIILGSKKIDLFGYPYPYSPGNDNDFFIISGSPFFTKREVFLNSGGYCENIFMYGEDIELSWRLNILGYKLFINVETYIHHFGGGVSGTLGFRWISKILLSQLTPVINCYSLPLLIIVVPVYLIYTITIVFLLFIKNSFNFSIISNYFQELSRILSKMPEICEFRRFVQSKRRVSDIKILKYISLVPAFIFKKSWKRVG